MKLNIYLLNTILLLWGFSAPAQTGFQLAIGGPGEETCAEVMMSNGRYHWVGHTTSTGAGAYDIAYIQTDTNGRVLHTTISGMQGEDLAIAACMNATGDRVAATGYTSSYGWEHPFVVAYDTAGAHIWSKYYPIHGWGLDITGTADGGYLLTGRHNLVFGLSDNNMFLLKLDAMGQIQWSRSFGDTLINEGRAVAVADDGSIYLGGFTHVQPGGPTDMVVLKLDSEGRLLWSKQYGYYFNGWDMTQTVATLGNDLLLGSISYTDKFSAHSEDALILHLDPNGNIKRSFAVGTADYDQVRDIKVHADKTFTITGLTTGAGNGKTDFIVVRLDTNGVIHNQRVLGGGDFDNGLSVAQHGNSLLLTGYTQSFGGGQNDMYLHKIPLNPQPNCNQNNSSLQSAPVTLTTTTPAYGTDTIISGGIFATMYENHPTLAYLNLCPQPQPNNIETRTKDVYTLYPNPASDYVQLHIPADARVKKIVLYDPLGRTVRMLNASEQNIPLADLAIGVYQVVIDTEKGKEHLKLHVAR